MNKTAAAAGSASLTTIVILFAMHGKNVGEALMSLWLVMVAFSKDAPLGLSSFLLSLAMATFSQPFLRKWLPLLDHREARRFIIDASAIGIGFAIMWVQLRTLPGLMLGILAGLAAPPIAKAGSAIWALVGRSLVLMASQDPEQDPET